MTRAGFLLVLCSLTTLRVRADNGQAIVDRFRAIAREGLEVERLRGSYNLLADRVFERYPQLLPLAALAGLPRRFDTVQSFSVEFIRWLDSIDARWFRIGPLDKESALALLAQGLRDGRLAWREEFLLASDRWRRLPPLDRSDLAFLRSKAGESSPESARPSARGSDGRTRARIAPLVSTYRTWLRRLGERAAPILVRAGCHLIEDFLIHYGIGARDARALSDEEFLKVLGSGALPPKSRGKRPFDSVVAEPLVEAGLERLFTDLSGELLGVDPRQGARLVSRLPRDEGAVLALGGYLVRAGGLAGVALHRVGTDCLQLALGKRLRIVWLRERGDLEKLLLDPAVTEIRLMGHGSMESFAYEGFTGPPEQTLARLLSWGREHATEIASGLVETIERRNARPFLARLEGELRLGWRTWDYPDFEAIARRAEFRLKDRIVLYACGLDELIVRDAPKGFQRTLLEVVDTRDQVARWLDFRRSGASFSLNPVSTAADRSFRSGLPELLAEVARRLEKPLRIEGRRDFVKLLARDARRFPGASWAQDFVLWPEGKVWDTADLVREVREALKLAPR